MEQLYKQRLNSLWPFRVINYRRRIFHGRFLPVFPQHSCACEFLWGVETDDQHVRLVKNATATNYESEIKDVHAYHKDGKLLLLLLLFCMFAVVL